MNLLFSIVLLGSLIVCPCLIWSQSPQADLLYLKRSYPEAALEYLNSPQLQNQKKYLAHFKAARSFLQSHKESGIQKALEQIEYLLAELEADTELFARVLHLRIQANFKLGHLQKALRQLEADKGRLFKYAKAESRGICEFLYRIDQNPNIAKKCKNKLSKIYPQALILSEVLNLSIAMKDAPVIKPIALTNAKLASNSGSAISANSFADSNPFNSQEKTKTLPISSAVVSQSSVFRVQVGAFGKESNAQTLKTNLDFLGRDITIQQSAVGGSKLYLVQITGFKTSQEAEAFARSEITPEGLTYRVVSK